MAPPAKTSTNMIAAIIIAIRPLKTPYEPLKKAESRCFMPMKLTVFSETEHVI